MYSDNSIIDCKNSSKKWLQMATHVFQSNLLQGFENNGVEVKVLSVPPIIATDVGANKDMIESKGGIIVPAKNAQSIIDAFEVVKDSKNVYVCDIESPNSLYETLKEIKTKEKAKTDDRLLNAFSKNNSEKYVDILENIKETNLAF
jgi:glycosyltransferase involved in cell wall biosynthesis